MKRPPIRFREKTYIITLLLFLVFLNAGIFTLAYYTQQQTADGEKAVCLAEQDVISRAFESDIKNTGKIGKFNTMHTYGSYYSEKQVFLAFSLEGETLYSSLPQGIEPSDNGYSATKRVDGKRYFIITATTESGYLLTYAKDVSYLDEDFKRISTVFVVFSLIASAILAIILFLILRKLSAPLERLRTATEEIARGNFSSRADDSGNDEFSMLAKDINKMATKVNEQLEHLAENAETKQLMLDNLAHEMRTPLTSIRGYAEYVMNANISEQERQEALEYIVSESERLRLVGERLLDEAFIRENGIVPEKTNMNELISKAVKTLLPKAKEKDVTVSAESDIIYLCCDPILMGMVVTNLTDNALKACNAGGRIEINCRKEEDNIIISVSDDGIGMTQQQLERITEPFYRTDKSRSRIDGGTGLGLSLCDKIVKAHGAKLIFSSQPEKGTKAFVIFTTL